ncbi:glycosyl transferase family 2 [Thermaerobacter marianensis DSM 12885]|uniref:Glycosyl transferase family 2 n=1 Tax=Thermaerobacter marianensis (strain ATCC 700841 / DSM 12885 / JCM 10246 / 7p75a) TaxID=644966 RepID=E6SGY3_THEM7|nr:glycosyltransferase family 2 protein [Thermaerobacter marianensis]ADU50614.1 glycosyl transferase family 2 [Thermaerobacter marianensis DSM 12885]
MRRVAAVPLPGGKAARAAGMAPWPARPAVRAGGPASPAAGPAPPPAGSSRPLVVVFLPAYNEAEAIGDVLRRIPRPAWPGWRTLVMVLDDGSTDGTGDVARAAGADLVVRHPRNRGLGYTVRQALRLAYRLGADAAVMIDADGEYPPETIPHVLAPIVEGRADYVLGSRFRGRIRGMRWYRRLGNYAFTLLQAVILRRWLSDGQTGLRAFSRPALRDGRIVHDYNYAQVLNLSLLRQGYRLAEVPIAYRVRETGESFIRFRDYVRRVLPAIWRELTLPVERRGAVGPRGAAAASRSGRTRPPGVPAGETPRRQGVPVSATGPGGPGPGTGARGAPARVPRDGAPAGRASDHAAEGRPRSGAPGDRARGGSPG